MFPKCKLAVLGNLGTPCKVVTALRSFRERLTIGTNTPSDNTTTRMNKSTRTLSTAGKRISGCGFKDEERRANTAAAASWPCTVPWPPPPAADRTILPNPIQSNPIQPLPKRLPQTLAPSSTHPSPHGKCNPNYAIPDLAKSSRANLRLHYHMPISIASPPALQRNPAAHDKSQSLEVWWGYRHQNIGRMMSGLLGALAQGSDTGA